MTGKMRRYFGELVMLIILASVSWLIAAGTNAKVAAFFQTIEGLC